MTELSSYNVFDQAFYKKYFSDAESLLNSVPTVPYINSPQTPKQVEDTYLPQAQKIVDQFSADLDAYGDQIKQDMANMEANALPAPTFDSPQAELIHRQDVDQAIKLADVNQLAGIADEALQGDTVDMYEVKQIEVALKEAHRDDELAKVEADIMNAVNAKLATNNEYQQDKQELSQLNSLPQTFRTNPWPLDPNGVSGVNASPMPLSGQVMEAIQQYTTKFKEFAGV
jgi:hypothetical protein